MAPDMQGRLIASIAKTGREQFRITIRDYTDNTAKVEIRVFERRRDHDWEATPRHIVIGRDYLLGVVEGLLEASALLKQEAA
ncbi:hypothetical protein [Bradyrhizobium elkanii]|jgi:hypothetical protein|uniref:hypothetical protein n=1 Tax=Bradyrhizobium elkanii TaxID=29448 RepID=UPI0004BB3F9B|nr:hypothetical protein [Bradyrhizobium elkanii]WLB77148.1 hypothetical protein QIH83_22295 [Bradyrhizobium elkanii]